MVIKMDRLWRGNRHENKDDSQTSLQVQLLERQQEEVQERRLVAGGGGGEVDHTLLSVVGACSGRTNLREESENTVQVLENQFYK